MKNLTAIIITFLFFAKTIAQKEDIEIIDLYYADKKGNKIEDVHLGTEYVYLTLITKNAKGKEFNIDLSEEIEMGYIFYYKRKLISAPFNIKIKKDIQKLKLKINYDNFPLQEKNQVQDALK